MKPVTAVEMTITGKVSNDKMQVTADDGTVYEIKRDDMGETIIVCAGKKVEVTGNVKTKKGKKILSVDHFKVISQ